MDGKRSADEDRESYRAGYEQDAANWRARLDAMEADGLGKGDPPWDEAHAALDQALSHLKHYSGTSQKTAEKRPARAKETRE